MKMSRVVAPIGVLVTAIFPVIARTQTLQLPLQTEARLDGIFATASAVHAGLGLSVPTGIYLRTGVVGGVGAGKGGADGRLDIVGRFTLDPFRQSRWAPYAGAGLSQRFRTDDNGGHGAFLLIYLGVEGPLPHGEQNGWAPALELGLGGGARIGFIMRRGIHGRR